MPNTHVAPQPRVGIDRTLARWTAALYLCIALTLLLVLGMAVWGVYHDLNQVRETFIGSEMQRLRSHAERTVIRLQNTPLDDDFKASGFLRAHWQTSVLNDPSRLYSCVIDQNGQVFMHSDPRQEGQRLGEVWYDRVVLEAGDDVVDTRSPALTGGRRGYDVRVPVLVGDQPVGSYHTGLSYDWLEAELAERSALTRQTWSWILGGILLAVVVAGYSLSQISRRIALLSEAVKLARGRRFAEIGQLMIAIVHEIRNPLNAIRLNLHVLDRQHKSADATDEEAALDQTQIILETNQEIERMERLMRMLLHYARPDQPQPENLDLRPEIESTLQFLKPVLEKSEVAVRARFQEAPVQLRMDRDRLRQILINLITNAKEATGPGGLIEISLLRRQGEVELVVADDGPGVPPGDREKIFQPFHSTKENGTGLGLALVRRYVEEMGGTIQCEANQPRGALFRLRLTETSAPLLPSDAQAPSLI